MRKIDAMHHYYGYGVGRCEFLVKCGADSYCGTCKQIMGECFTNGNDCGSEHFWKKLLTKWMEEQDAAD